MASINIGPIFTNCISNKFETIYNKYINVYFNCDTVLLWTAPELLNHPNPPLNGTPLADIYSLGIVIQEILYRCPPFQSCGNPPRSSKGDLMIDLISGFWIDFFIETSEIVMRVKNAESPPFRPRLNEDPKIDSRYLDMARDCWAEDKNTRPLTSRLITRFNSFNKGKLARLLGCCQK